MRVKIKIKIVNIIYEITDKKRAKEIHMTRQEIIELKEKIDKNFDILEKKFLHTKLVSDTIQTLLKYGASKSEIRIFLDTMEEFVEEVQRALKEIES